MKALVAGLLALILGTSAPRAHAALLSSVQTIMSGGHARTFYYYKPDNFDPSKGMIFWLHGGGGSAQGVWTTNGDYLWKRLADRVGVLIVLPEGKPRNGAPDYHKWNNCLDDIDTASPAYTDWDDVGFIKALVPWATSNISGALATNRVYAAGHSDGSMMVERLALEANDVIAAIGVVAGNLPVANDNRASYKCSGYTAPWTVGTAQAVPTFLYKGDEDPVLYYGPRFDESHNTFCEAQDPGQGYCEHGAIHSYWDTVAFWQWKLGISLAATSQVTASATTYYPDDTPETCPYNPNNPNDLSSCDGTRIFRYTYGPAPYRLVYDRSTHGGHMIPSPSAQSYSDYQAFGYKNRDNFGQARPWIAEEMWAFFSQFTLAD